MIKHQYKLTGLTVSDTDDVGIEAKTVGLVVGGVSMPIVRALGAIVVLVLPSGDSVTGKVAAPVGDSVTPLGKK